MKALETINVLGDLCASQKGMFTTAQALSLGAERMTISRLLKNGQIVQLLRGVYRFSAAPSFREEDVYAVWLSLDPKTPSFNRANSTEDFVASLNTAAWLLNFGELEPEPIVFSHDKRHQTRRKIRFIKRNFDFSEVEIVAGIPTTSPKRTILDLINAGEDLSLVASVLKDAEFENGLDNIEDEVNKLSQKCGFDKKFNLYEHLRGKL